MALIDDIKITLRISATTTAMDTEIDDLIDAARQDLILSGVTVERADDDTDPLTKRAITIYVKANFGWDNPDAERLQRAYDMLKSHLALSADYGYHTVTFSVTDDVTGLAIRKAVVIFDDQEKSTDENGQAVFTHIQTGTNYFYTVSATDYISDADEDNLLDVSADTAVAIALTER